MKLSIPNVSYWKWFGLEIKVYDGVRVITLMKITIFYKISSGEI